MGEMSFVPRELDAFTALVEGWWIEPAPGQRPVYRVVELSRRPASG